VPNNEQFVSAIWNEKNWQFHQFEGPNSHQIRSDSPEDKNLHESNHRSSAFIGVQQHHHHYDRVDYYYSAYMAVEHNFGCSFKRSSSVQLLNNIADHLVRRLKGSSVDH